MELPAFQPGLWEYQRTTTVTGARGVSAPITVKKCTDPSKEIHERLAEMKQRGCQFAPVSRSGNRYRYSWMCPVRGGSLMITQVITVKNPESYEDSNESRYGQRVDAIDDRRDAHWRMPSGPGHSSPAATPVCAHPEDSPSCPLFPPEPARRPAGPAREGTSG